MSDETEIEGLDLSNDEGHAGDDWDTLLNEAGAGEGDDVGGELITQEEYAGGGYEDALRTAFSTSSHIFGLGLSSQEVDELARAWDRVAGHYMPRNAENAGPLTDALMTTGAVAVPRVLAHVMKPGEGPEPGPGQEQDQQQSSNVHPIRGEKGVPSQRWAEEPEREW